MQQSVNYLLRAILEPGLTSITERKLMNKELLFVRISSVRAFQRVLQADMEMVQEVAAPDLNQGFKGSS